MRALAALVFLLSATLAASEGSQPDLQMLPEPHTEFVHTQEPILGRAREIMTKFSGIFWPPEPIRLAMLMARVYRAYPPPF